MDYDKLKTFAIVSANSSFSTAAKLLHRTQPAISQQISWLEGDLGFQLFSKRKGGVSLSPEGQRLFNVIQKSFEDIDSEVAELREQLGQMEGNIRVGVLMDYSTPFDIAEILMASSQKFPKVNFSITFGSNEELEMRLLNNSIDIAFSIVFKDKASFSRTPILRTHHSFIGSAATRERLRRKKLPEILLESHLIDFDDEFMCIRPWVRKVKPELLPLLKKRRPSAVLPNHLESLKMVAKDWGIAILPDHLCQEQLAAGTLCKLFPKLDSLSVELDMAFNRNRSLRKCEERFAQFVVEHASRSFD